MNRDFPPPWKIGFRVWTAAGFKNHGPEKGPTSDVPGNMGGTITHIEVPPFPSNFHLYTVKWDNGQVTKHPGYEKKLRAIGRFQTLEEFESAIRIIGCIRLTLGPYGGFKYVEGKVAYDGKRQSLDDVQRDDWYDVLEPIARRQNAEIIEIELPRKPRKPRSK